MRSSGFPSNTETSEIAGRSQPEHDQSEGGRTALSKLADRVIADCPDGIFTHDLEFRLILWNPAMERLSGIRKEQALGKGAFHVFPFLKGDGADKADGGKLNGEAVVYDEVSFAVPQTGQRGVYQCQYSPLRNEQGEIVGGLGIVHDVSKHKRAEEALHESEERYRTLVEAAPDVIYTVSAADGLLTSLNPAFETLTGWSRAEWLGKPLVGIVHPDDLPVALETLQKAARGGTQPPYELRVLSKSGEYLVGEFTSTPHVKDGKVVGELGIARDITERHRGEEALRDSEKRFRLLFERAPLGYQSLDENGCFIDVNPAWLDVFGYTREEVIGHWFGDFMTPESAEAVKKNFPRFKAAGEIYGLEYEMVRKDGSHFIASVNGKIGYDEQGRFAQTHCILADITERKQAEEGLRASEQRYRLLFERNLAGVFRTSVDGRILDCNEAFARLYGYSSREEILSCQAWELYHDPADREAFIASLKNQHELTNVEYCLRRKDGSSVWVLENSTLLEGEDDAPAVIEGTSIDITERKRAEEALRLSQEMFQKAFNASPEPVTISTLQEGIYIDVNERYLQTTGYHRDEVIGRRALEVGFWEQPEDRARMMHVFERDGSVHDFQMTFVTKSGEKRNGLLSAEVIETGGQRCLLAITRDITERKQVEEALRLSQEMFQKAFQASPDTMVLHSLSEGRHMDVNESFLRLVGYRREELVGRTAMDLGLWWDLAQGNEYLRILREQGRVRDLEICVRTKSGQARTLLLSAEVIEIAGQDCVVAIGKDISEQKKAEQERPRLEEQLRQAQKMEAVGRLAGGVAHDFNNILMVINGYVQLVLRKLSPRHPLRQNLNEIRKAGERAASLTGQLLAFSRRQILVPRILDLNKVVADTKEMLRRVIGEDVELVIRQGCKLAKVLADPGQIAQVLVNLAVNARDAMPGGGRLTIETGNVDLRGAETGDLPGAAPGPYVMLAVSDTGVGMSREVMEHMFEPFFTTRERGKGTGLGLSTVYGIVKQSGGYVRAQSEPGQGSAFRIYLPCAQVGSGKPAARSTKARLAKGRETILVVEDELAVRQVVAATLRSCGYKVLEAGSGEEAMRRLRRHEGPLHLALCDLVMPRMNGRKVADSVRTLYPEVKVVFMSGYTDDALLRHGISGTQGSFLQKPFTMEALTQKVREVLAE
jgi:PAS domain S-box-containing protein